MKLEFYESVFELEETDEVYATMDKEVLESWLKDLDEEPCNEDGDPDNNYIGADVQFIFEKNTDNLIEILVFPMYEVKYEGEEETSITNGEFVSLDDDMMDELESHKDKAYKYMTEHKPETIS